VPAEWLHRVLAQQQRPQAGRMAARCNKPSAPPCSPAPHRGPRRQELLQDLAQRSVEAAVGTHALLEDPVQFAGLAWWWSMTARFAVRQGAPPAWQGTLPAPSAHDDGTPIPRTWRLSVHGDLEVSQNRRNCPRGTPVCNPLAAGVNAAGLPADSQRWPWSAGCMWSCPLVEETETLDLRSAVEVHNQSRRRGARRPACRLLHGRMDSHDKQAAITAFAGGATDVLVSHHGGEVGVDVPEASVMVI